MTSQEYQSTFSYTGEPSYPNNYVMLYLYKHEGNDYVSLERDDLGKFNLARGEYTLVIYETQIILGQSTWEGMGEWIRERIIPSAYAQTDTSRRFTITFSVEGEDPPPPPSNVLFIPGVLGITSLRGY